MTRLPELPEVETVRRGAERCLCGRTLRSVELRRNDLRWPIPVAAVQGLVGATCTSVERRAKYLLLGFDAGRGRSATRTPRTALIHLGMSGRLFVDEPDETSARGVPEWRVHEHWRMTFDGHRILRFVDPRRFGALDVAATETLAAHPLLAHLGPEPFDDTRFDADTLFRATRDRKVAIKTFVMDAKNVVGVGNIYASEACFRAGVRPRRSAASLTRAECARLTDAIRSVLGDAIAAGGTTLRDYVGVDEGTGYFQRDLAVYGRGGEPCPVCSTPIRHVVSGQRSTYFCAHCQR